MIIIGLLFAVIVIASIVYTLGLGEPRGTATVLFLGTIPALLLFALAEFKDRKADARASQTRRWQKILGAVILAIGIITAIACVIVMASGDSATILTPDTTENFASSLLFISVPVSTFGWALRRGLLST